jgi:DHA2 family multidrug resistance protein-like MFS transporter
MAMGVLEATITNVALPSISQSFDVNPADSVWIVNTYQLAIVASLLPFASLGEVLGYRRLFGAGLLGFVVASAGCALSPTFGVLLAFRVVQGLAASCMMSVSPALLRFTYSQKEFGRAIGYNALVVAVSSAAGPMIGSFILSISSWPWLFAINVPVGLFVLAIGTRMLPTTDLARRSFDWLSAVLSAVFFGLFVIAVDRLLTNTSAAMVMLAGAAVAGFMLVRRELGQTTPLLPLDLLAIRPFAFSIGASITAFAGQAVCSISLPFYFQQVMSRSQLEIGMLMVPWPLAVAVAAPIASRLAERISPAILCGVGSSVVAVGMIAVALLPPSASNGLIMTFMALSGLGFGCFQTPNNRVMLTAAPRQRSGSAGGMQATARQSGMALGAALTALAFTAIPEHGARTGLFVGALFSLASAAVSASRSASRPSQGSSSSANSGA